MSAPFLSPPGVILRWTSRMACCVSDRLYSPERVQREIDVGAVLVAAGREIALDEFRRVLGERAAVVAGTRPVAVGDFRNHVAAFPQRFEHHAHVELHAERVLDAYFYVVEVDENRNLESCVCQNLPVFPSK